MPLGLLTAGATLIGGVISAGAASDAAKVQGAAADKATATQLKMYETTRDDLKPFADVGRSATYSLADLYGLPTPQNPEGGQPYSQSSLDAFSKSPDYKYAYDEGLRGVEASAAARGNLQSGGTLKALQERGMGLASQNFGNYVSRLSDLARLGYGAAGATGSAALSTGRGVADTTMAAGEAGASGIVGGANAINTSLGDTASNLALAYRRANPTQSAYTSSLPKWGTPGAIY